MRSENRGYLNHQRTARVDEVTGHTKKELAQYYAAISEWALPHLHNRPLALVRPPDGINGELFSRSTERKPVPPARSNYLRDCTRVILRYWSPTAKRL